MLRVVGSVSESRNGSGWSYYLNCSCLVACVPSTGHPLGYCYEDFDVAKRLPSWRGILVMVSVY